MSDDPIAVIREALATMQGFLAEGVGAITVVEVTMVTDALASLAQVEKERIILADLADWWEKAARFLAERYDVPTEVMQEALGAESPGGVLSDYVRAPFSPPTTTGSPDP